MLSFPPGGICELRPWPGRSMQRSLNGFFIGSVVAFNFFDAFVAGLSLAHCCTIFLCHWDGKYSTGWQPPIGGGEIRNEAPAAKIYQIGPGFLQNVHALVVWEKDFFFGFIFTFFGGQGDLFPWGVTFFKNCGSFPKIVVQPRSWRKSSSHTTGH